MTNMIDPPAVDPSSSYHFVDPFEMEIKLGNATISLWGQEAITPEVTEHGINENLKCYYNPQRISITCPTLRLCLEGPLYHHGQSCAWNSEYEDEKSERRRQVETDLCATVRAALAVDPMFETAWLNGRIEKIFLGENNTVKTVFNAHLRLIPIAAISARTEEKQLLQRIRQLMIEYAGYIFRLKGASTEDVELKEDYGDLPKILEKQEKRIDEIIKGVPSRCPVYPVYMISEYMNVDVIVYQSAEMVPWESEYADVSAPKTLELAKQLCEKMDHVIRHSFGLRSFKPDCSLVGAVKSAAGGVQATLHFRLLESVLTKYKFTVKAEKFLRFVRNILVRQFIEETIQPTCFKVNLRGLVYKSDKPVKLDERLVSMEDEEALVMEADLCATTKEALTVDEIFDDAWYDCSLVTFNGPTHGKLECELRLVLYATTSMKSLDGKIEPTIQDLIIGAGQNFAQGERYHFMILDHTELEKPAE
ncbi:unnamed protein product [Calicophoron daubneyi]|uniref:Vitellogenin n=1 Tax=Calicophoron daubneyi TaxID=300641 RepID=A0AAV2TY72_CALDB